MHLSTRSAPTSRVERQSLSRWVSLGHCDSGKEGGAARVGSVSQARGKTQAARSLQESAALGIDEDIKPVPLAEPMTGNDLNNARATFEIVETRRLGDVPHFPYLIGTFMGRDALSLAVSYLDLTKDDTVVLPVFTCQDVLKSFVRKCHVLFYDVGRERERKTTGPQISSQALFRYTLLSCFREIAAEYSHREIQQSTHCFAHGSGVTASDEG